MYTMNQKKCHFQSISIYPGPVIVACVQTSLISFVALEKKEIGDVSAQASILKLSGLDRRIWLSCM